MVTPTENYQDVGRRLLLQARAELAAGDLPQASEKGWGAAVQMVKAAAQQRGWPHDQHRLLFAIVRELSNEAGDPEIHALFMSPNGLHVNFYEGEFDADMVAYHLDRAERFVARLEGLLGG